MKRLKSESSGDQQKEKDQSPYKIALFKNYRWSFPPTKNTKKDFHQSLHKKEGLKKALKKKALKKKALKKESFKKKAFKKKDFKKERVLKKESFKKESFKKKKALKRKP